MEYTESNSKFDILEVPLEVQEEHLGASFADVVKGRVAPHRERPAAPLPPRDHGRRVDAVGRKRPRPLDAQVRRREPHRPPPAVPMPDVRPKEPRVPQVGRGARDVPLPYPAADRGAGDEIMFKNVTGREDY